jgi:hypothetical protein
MSDKTGIYAFPLDGNQVRDTAKGMTLRDYFAAKAMAGMLSGDKMWTFSLDQIHLQAYGLADLMLEARAK